MSKVRNLPQLDTPASGDFIYVVDTSESVNAGRKLLLGAVKEVVMPTASEIKTLYESNPDTNEFSDAEKVKLAGISPGATPDQSASGVPYDNADSGLVATNVQDALDEVSEATLAGFKPTAVSGRILHYTEGTARFDDVFFSILAGDILLDPSITNGEVYVDLDGIVKQTGSGVNAPPLTIVFAKFSTDLNNIISLTDERVKNTQNLVRGLVADVRDVRAGAAASAGASGRLSDAMHKHNILTGAPSTQTPDQANAEGSSTNLARADHVHTIPAGTPTTSLSPATTNSKGVAADFALSDHGHAVQTSLVGDITTILPDDSASAGTVDKFARGDHRHGIAAAAASTQTPDQSNSEGVSTSFARADHGHNIPAGTPSTTLSPATSNAKGVAASFALSDHTHAVATALVGDITTIQPDDSASAGTANTFARGDHRHAIVAAAPSNTGSANSEGSSTSFARADHIHNTTIANSSATATADDTTTSLTDVQIAGMTLTPAAGTYLVTFSSSVLNSGNGSSRLFVSIYSAGAQVTHSEREIGIAGGANVPVHTNAIVTVNGSQAIQAMWRAVAGTNTAHKRSLTLVRLGD